MCIHINIIHISTYSVYVVPSDNCRFAFSSCTLVEVGGKQAAVQSFVEIPEHTCTQLAIGNRQYAHIYIYTQRERLIICLYVYMYTSNDIHTFVYVCVYIYIYLCTICTCIYEYISYMCMCM